MQIGLERTLNVQPKKIIKDSCESQIVKDCSLAPERSSTVCSIAMNREHNGILIRKALPKPRLPVWLPPRLSSLGEEYGRNQNFISALETTETQLDLRETHLISS